MKHTLQVAFQTNEIIIADWIKIDEFLTQVWPSQSLNSYHGMINSTQEAAEQHGFVRVHIGDIDPTMFRKDNDFSFGLAKEKKNYDEVGSVYVGVWAVTMIEKQKLIDIVANKVGLEKSQEIVKNYLDTHQHTVAHVEKGTYTLKFDPDSSHSAEMFSLKKDKIAKTKKLKF
jgi:hypothetical protein